MVGDGGTPVILLHGLGAAAEIWLRNVWALAGRHRVMVPDLVGFGCSDVPDAQREFPNVRLKIMPECGHIPFWENPDEFNREVLEFLA